ncbi:MAG: hypothetical protein IH892_20455, partial [Planctomycetes bacterium]|nr:hypothetical protein [Planctomycetota bacterium]
MCQNYHHFPLFTLIALALTCSLAWSFDPLGDPDLIAWWTFNEGKGTLAADSSKNGRDATVNGNAQWVPGQYGSALEFDGTDDYVGIQESLFTNLGQFTIACWLAGDLSGASRTGLVGQNDCIEYGFISSNTIQIWTPGGGSLNVAWPYSDLDWHHIVAVGDGSALTVYIDGEQAGTGGSSTSSYGSSTFNVNIGGGGVYDGSGNWFTGMIDDVGLFSRGLSAEEVLVIMEGVVSPALASDPNPDNEDPDVGRDTTLGWTPGEFANTHDVYLGVTFDDVNVATVADPGGVLVGQGLADATFDPGRFEFGQSYYWRVDEVNAAPDSTVFKGGVWSFTVEPFSIPIDNITATASSSFGASGPEKTVDGSGLADDLHGSSASDMWISGGIPATIEFAFDRAYKLHELWIWNSNQLIEAFVGFGAKDVVIEHSLDGENWSVLDGVGPLAQAPGTEGYAHNNTIDFGGATAQHVRLTVNSVQGIAPQASLSEVRFYYVPTFATRPNPASDATDVAPDTTLSWGRNGREAGSHEIYVGTNADDLALAGAASESSFSTDALDLQLGQTYSWRVDEINDVMDPSTWEGTVWSFTTVDAIIIDDMESYKDEEFLEIWATWVDGFDDPANGSLVGKGAAFAPETDIVHGGSQSLPMNYDNRTAAQSEATRTFDAPMDWTGHGIQSLVLYLNRGADNTGGGQVYVKINDTKIVYEGGAELPPGWDLWTQWTIDLSAVADAASVRSLTIGVEGAGATGVLYVDSIQLVTNAPTA